MGKGQLALLGDEAVALGAIHAGISAAYGYPGTPSTEILQYLIDEYKKGAPPNIGSRPIARWCSNEKTALEAGLGVSFAGRRSIITMKHVGLNVAADPFINAALLGIKGGFVIAVADDPGMHSSQNEQDSRFYAAFAMIPCLEPRSQQEAYDMTREAFNVSERFQVPVLLRLSTRLSHARAAITTRDIEAQKPVSKTTEKNRWMLLPAMARKNYAALIEKQNEIMEWSASHPANKLELPGMQSRSGLQSRPGLAVITAGLGGNYYEENLADFTVMRNGKPPARLHIGAYPLPEKLIREICAVSEKIMVIEEGQPFIEEKLRGILPQSVEIIGRLGGPVSEGNKIPRTGELDPDNVRAALGLPPRPSAVVTGFDPASLPARPPQLCKGCPHADSYDAIKKAAESLDPRPGHPDVGINSDIGCYSLGAAPPYQVPESIVCMGASVGMAKGAADAGLPYSVAIIGDSTFIHSGITALIDAVASDTPMTLVILDNSIVAMTGCQPTMVPSEKLRALLLGCGVKQEHLLELEARKNLVEENAARLKAEIEYRGFSVAVFKRECLEAARKNK